MDQFETFLQKLTTQVRNLVSEQTLDDDVELVVGNESCDLDSAVSALLYAYFLQLEANANSQTTRYIPLLQVKRDDFPIKTEVVYTLNKYSVSPDCFLFDDELPRPLSPVFLHVVDHNASSGQFEDASRFQIKSVVDHHQFEHTDITETEFSSSMERYIREIVGSCSTLIAKLLLSTTKSKSALNKSALTLRAAQLLRATILCDTGTLSPYSGKTTKLDVHVVEELEQMFTIADSREEVFVGILKAKLDTNSLNCPQILLKDMKSLEVKNMKIIISSCPITLQEFCNRPDSNSSFSSVLTQTQSSVLVVKFANHHLFLHTPVKSDAFQQMVCRLESDESLKLKVCMPSSDLHLPDYHQVFTLADSKITRKQILPAIREILTSLSSQGPDMSRLRIDSSSDLTFQLELSGNNTPTLYDSPARPSSHDNSGFQTPVSPMNSASNTVPPNSFMDAGTIDQAMLHLPSFNNSEMVKRIMLKKEKMAGDTSDPPGGVSHKQEIGGTHSQEMGVVYRQEAGRTYAHSAEILDYNCSVPFTPVNSFVESFHHPQKNQPHMLPSFYNKEMVTRILSGRNQTEDVEGSLYPEAEDEIDEDNMKSTELFTPHNSVCGSFVNSMNPLSKLAVDQPCLNREELRRRLSQVEGISPSAKSVSEAIQSDQTIAKSNQSEKSTTEVDQSETLAARATAQQIVDSAIDSALEHQLAKN